MAKKSAPIIYRPAWVGGSAFRRLKRSGLVDTVMKKEHQRLALENIKLVTHALKSIWGIGYVKRYGWEESIASGYVALCTAARLYRPSSGIKFSTYAFTSIRRFICKNASVDALIKHPEPEKTKNGSTRERLARNARTIKSLEVNNGHGGTDSWDDIKSIRADRNIRSRSKVEEWHGLVMNEIESLADGEKRAFMAYFFDRKSFKEIGVEFGCSGEVIRRMVRNTASKIKENVHARV